MKVYEKLCFEKYACGSFLNSDFILCALSGFGPVHQSFIKYNFLLLI